MARKKHINFLNAFGIFFSSVKTFFLYFDQTTKILLFPIFGQILAIILIFTLTYFYVQNGHSVQAFIPFFNTNERLFITFIVLLIPLFFLFAKAFYEYIIRFSSLNLLYYTNSGKKKVKNIDFEANDNVIQRKLFNYIILMLIITIMCITPLILILPLACMAFQVFALEGNISPIKAVTRSIEMVKANFIPTMVALALCFFFTYMFLPALFIWAAEKTSIYYFMMGACEKFIVITPLHSMASMTDLGILNEYINEILSPVAISRNITEGIISFIVLGFTLPLRCCYFTELYRLYDSEKIKENSKTTDEIVKRATSKK